MVHSELIKIHFDDKIQIVTTIMDEAMDQQARKMPGEYRRKVADVDREHFGTTPGQVGPLQTRLEELAGGGGLQDLLGLCWCFW